MLLRATTPVILRRFGYKRVIIINGLLAGIFIAVPAFFTTTTPHLVVGAAILVGGFFRALQFSSVNSLAFADLNNEQMSQATSMTSVAQQLSLAAGVAIAALALDATRFARGDIALVAADFAPAFVFVGVLSMCSVAFFLRLPKDAGSALTTPKKVAAVAREPDLPG
jgi:MFS family permease